MKKIIVVILISFVSHNLIAQKSFNIGLSAGKFCSGYRYFQYYKGKISINGEINYNINNRFNLHSEINYGFMYNQRIDGNGYVYNIEIGPAYKLINKNKFQIFFSLGSGFQYIYMKSLNEIIEFHEDLKGIPINGNIKINFPINEKLNIFFKYNTQYGFMFYDIDFSDKKQFFRTYFNSFNIGLSYLFVKN